MVRLLIMSFLLWTPFSVWAQEIDVLIFNNQYDIALQKIEESLSKDEAQPLLHLKRGMIYQRQFDYQNALKSLIRANQLDSLNPGILSELADLYSGIGDHKRALPLLETLYRNDSTDIAATLKLVRGYFSVKVFDKPFGILQSAYRRDSINLLVNKNLALCATYNGKIDLAISLYMKLIKINPYDLANFVNLASAYQNKKNDIEVIGTLEQGLRFFPDEPQLLIKLGDFQYHIKNYPKAILAYERCLTKADSVPSVLKNLGICYFLQKKPAIGLPLLEKCLKSLPEDAVTAFYLGLCYKDLGNIKKGIEYLNYAAQMAIPPYLGDIYNHLGNAYYENNNYKKAIPVLQKAYELDNKHSDVLFSIAVISEKIQGNKSLLIKYYDNYLKAAKLDTTATRKLIEYAKMRRIALKEELLKGKKE